MYLHPEMSFHQVTIYKCEHPGVSIFRHIDSILCSVHSLPHQCSTEKQELHCFQQRTCGQAEGAKSYSACCASAHNVGWGPQAQRFQHHRLQVWGTAGISCALRAAPNLCMPGDLSDPQVHEEWCLALSVTLERMHRAAWTQYPQQSS